MKNYKNIYKKASKLMEESIKNYSLGNFNEGDKLRKKANNIFETAERIKNVLIKDDDALYGTERNFGIMYEVFENNAIKILKGKNKKAITEIVNIIKNNPILNEEFKVYSYMLKPSLDVKNTELYINEAFDCINLNKKDIINANNKMLGIIKKYNLYEMIDIDEDKLNLYNSINNIITTKKSINNAKIISESKEVVNSYIKNYINENKNKKNDNINFDEKINNIKESFVNLLNKDDFNYLKKFSEDKEKLFNEEKNRILKTLKENIEKSTGTDSCRLQNIYETINATNYSEDTVLDYLIKFNKIDKIIE